MDAVPKNAVSKEPLTALKTVGAQAEAWFKSQQAPAAGSASVAGGAQAAAPAASAAAAPKTKSLDAKK
eukprot:8185718-Pyramimonas_sp.AAC.1